MELETGTIRFSNLVHLSRNAVYQHELLRQSCNERVVFIQEIWRV